MGNSNGCGDRDRWARLRFAVVGPLLASPPPARRLRAELERLSQQDWEHPCGGGPVRFSASTIERWYYRARAAHQDPVGALRARPRTDAGRVRAMSAALVATLREQYRDHPSWSAQLHPRQPARACRCRPVSGADAVVRDADPGDALAGGWCVTAGADKDSARPSEPQSRRVRC